jgi:hypothetical protein
MPTIGSKKVIPTEKKKPGRRPTGRDPLMALRVPPEIRGRIEEFAKQKGITLSKAILHVLEKHLPKKGAQ